VNTVILSIDRSTPMKFTNIMKSGLPVGVAILRAVSVIIRI
jgi:hypothetical protein